MREYKNHNGLSELLLIIPLLENFGSQANSLLVRNLFEISENEKFDKKI
jgi:hypothetical protein